MLTVTLVTPLAPPLPVTVILTDPSLIQLTSNLVVSTTTQLATARFGSFAADVLAVAQLETYVPLSVLLVLYVVVLLTILTVAIDLLLDVAFVISCLPYALIVIFLPGVQV